MSIAILLFLALLTGGTLVFVGALFFADVRWNEQSTLFDTSLQEARFPRGMGTYDAREIEALPAPVRRYFSIVLQDGQPMIAGVHVRQHGRFRVSEERSAWRSFEARQFVTTSPPGFNWDARIRMLGGIKVYVQDAYAAGCGTLQARLFGLLRLAKMFCGQGLAEGELMRYLGEAAWYPTALLPSQGVHWESIDEHSARASLTDGDTRVSLEFHFDNNGLISTVWTPSRSLINAVGEIERAPWQGRFYRYVLRDGMQVPTVGEVEWQLTRGRFPYWRGRLVDIEYEFARP